MTEGQEGDSPSTGEPRARPKGRLSRKYTFLIGLLVSLVLIAAGSLEMWFSYQETKSTLLRIQKEKALAASSVIDRFVKEVESQMGWTMHAAFLNKEAAIRQRRFAIAWRILYPSLLSAVRYQPRQ